MRKLRNIVITPAGCLSEQRLEGHPTMAAKGAPGPRTTSTEARIKEWAFVTGPEFSEPELAMRCKFWEEKREFYRQLQALTPAQLTQFFDQHLAPLPVSAELETENLHDWSI